MTTTNTIHSKAGSPFDSVASIYDAELDASPIMPALREVVWNVVERYVPAGGAILELNCGTGTDALELARRGYRITATDLSEAMLAQAKAKSANVAVGNTVTWQQLNVAAAQSNMLRPESFDCIFSNFGGLNCLNPEQLNSGLNALSSALRPGGTLVLSIMGKYCAWEYLAFLLRGNLAGARRRTRKNALTARLGSTEFDVWYFSPDDITSMVKEWASMVDLLGLSILSPPPDSRAFIRALPGFTKVLLKADGIVRRVFPFSHIGDHFIFVARKRP